MVAQIRCDVCTGTFGPSIFENKEVHICRFCRSRELATKENDHLKAKLNEAIGKLDSLAKDVNECVQLRQEVKAANEKIDALTKKSEALQDFITLNFVGTTSDSNEGAANDVPVSTQDAFQVVRNNVRPKARKVIPTICQNRFQILTDRTDEEEEEVRLVGDSIVRGQLTEFCARAPGKRKRFCIPGGGVDDVIASLDEVSDLAPANTMYVVHVGTNDVQGTRSEELIAKYKRLIRGFKDKSRDIIISGILPRMKANQRFFNMATSTNRRLANICNEENVGFVNTWDSFFYDPSLFDKDGVHLSDVGAARFGRMLDDAVEDFRSKNGRPRVLGDT